MDPLGPDPLIRSFERYLCVENRSARTVTTYLIAVQQADAFLREPGTGLEAATRTDPEAFLGDLTCTPDGQHRRPLPQDPLRLAGRG
jgi:hypothetical protein